MMKCNMSKNIKHWKPNQKIGRYIYYYQDLNKIYVKRKFDSKNRRYIFKILNPNKSSDEWLSTKTGTELKNGWFYFTTGYDKKYKYYLNLDYPSFQTIKIEYIKTIKFCKLKNMEFLIKDTKDDNIYVGELIYLNQHLDNYNSKKIVIKRLY